MGIYTGTYIRMCTCSKLHVSKTTGIVQEKKKLWFIGVEVKHETRLEI